MKSNCINLNRKKTPCSNNDSRKIRRCACHNTSDYSRPDNVLIYSSCRQADYKYCIDGGPYCGDKEADCKALLESVSRDHKCLEVTIN